MTTIFEEVKGRVDFKDEAKQEKENLFFCGIHGDQESPDLKVYPEGNWKCFSCGSKGGDIISYVAERDNISQGEAAKQLIQEHNLEVETDEMGQEEKQRRRKLRKVRNCQEEVVKQAQNNLSTAKKEKLKERRGWSDETIQDLRIGWMDKELFNQLQERYQDLLQDAGIHFGMTGNKEGTYVFPHLKKNGQPYLITCRDPNPDEDHKKYQQSKSTEWVENDIYYATGHDSDTLIVTEGYPDNISAYEAGYDAVAAGCGSFEGNRNRISSFAYNYERVLVILDNDETGEEELQKIGRHLSKNHETLVYEWSEDKPEGYDLDDWTSDNSFDLNPLIEEAEHFLDAFQNYSPSSIDAEKVGKKITVRGNVKGQKQGDAIPEEVYAQCFVCGQEERLDLSKPETVESFLTSRQNQYNLIQSKLGNIDPDGCGGGNNHDWNWNIPDGAYQDKSWLQLQDLVEDSDSFSTTQNNKIPVYLIGEKMPTSKTLKVRGTVHVNNQNDEIFLIADEVEPEDQSFENLEFTEEDHREYIERWEKEKAEDMVATDMVGRRDSRTALQLAAHSPVLIPTLTGELTRGCLRVGFFGDGGTYKSAQVKDLTKDGYNLGGFVNAENSGRTGLTYTIDSDERVIEWGALVLNDRGLVGIDGLNELREHDITQMREVLEDLQVEVNRSVQGSAPARTRVIGCWNPPEDPMHNQYDNPADALKQMEQFSGPDYRRWDLLVPFSSQDVDKDDIHFREEGEKPYEEEFYRRHVLWAWSLTPDDITFGPEFANEVKTQSYNIARKYEYSELPIVTDAFREKLTRLSVSMAVLKHSVNEEYDVEVKADHVKEVKDYFEELMGDLGLKEEIEDYQEKTTLEQKEIDRLQEELEEEQVKIMQVVYESSDALPAQEIGEELDLSGRAVKKKWSKLKKENLLRVKSGQGAKTTPRQRQFFDKVHEVHAFMKGTANGGGEGREKKDDNTNPPSTPQKTKHENVNNVQNEGNSLDSKEKDQEKNSSSEGSQNIREDLTKKQQKVLDHLIDVPGRGDQALAEELDYSLSEVGDAIDELEDMGLVEYDNGFYPVKEVKS